MRHQQGAIPPIKPRHMLPAQMETFFGPHSCVSKHCSDRRQRFRGDGADIAFRPNFAGANNKIEDNFCLTYLQGAGPATAPCPNIRTEGVEEATIQPTIPPRGRNRSVPTMASLLAIPYGRSLVLLSLAFLGTVLRISSGRSRTRS